MAKTKATTATSSTPANSCSWLAAASHQEPEQHPGGAEKHRQSAEDPSHSSAEALTPDVSIPLMLFMWNSTFTNKVIWKCGGSYLHTECQKNEKKEKCLLSCGEIWTFRVNMVNKSSCKLISMLNCFSSESFLLSLRCLMATFHSQPLHGEYS